MTTDCAICLESLGTTYASLSCSHEFHASCIGTWLVKSGSCPVCRYRVREEDENEADNEDEQMTEEESQILFHMLGDYPFLRQQLVMPREQTSVHAPTITREDYALHVHIISQTPTHIEYEIEGRRWLAETRDALLVQGQTEASLEACLYAINKADNDIVSAIMDLCEAE